MWSGQSKKNVWVNDLLIASALPVLILILHALATLPSVSLDFMGVRPRSFKGLLGIISAPLVHGSWQHAINNAIPLVVLSFYILQIYRKVFFQVLIFGALMEGLWTWVSARDALHIGASGVVYVLFGFLFLSGILNRNKRTVGTTLIVVFLYGGLVWGIFPNDPKVSYEGHFWGLIAGLILAVFYRNEFKTVRFNALENLSNDIFISRAERKFGRFYWDKEKREAWQKQEAERIEKENEQGNPENSSTQIRYYYSIKKSPEK